MRSFYSLVMHNKQSEVADLKLKKYQEFIDNTLIVKHCMSDRLCVRVCVCVCASCVSSRAKVASSCHSSSDWEFKSSSLQPQHIWGNAQSSMHVTFPFSSAAQTLPALQTASSDAPQRHQWKRKKQKQNTKQKKSQTEKYDSGEKTLVTLVTADSVGLRVTRIFSWKTRLTAERRRQSKARQWCFIQIHWYNNYTIPSL